MNGVVIRHILFEEMYHGDIERKLIVSKMFWKNMTKLWRDVGKQH